MHASYSTIVSLLLSACAASPAPLSSRSTATTCDKAPSGPNHAVQPISQHPTAHTATLCVDACKAQSGCQSCAFGLPSTKEAPSCVLFGVPGSQVPPQSAGAELHVFDCDCADLPTEAPTHQQPRGPPRGSTPQTGGNGGGKQTGGGRQPAPGGEKQSIPSGGKQPSPGNEKKSTPAGGKQSTGGPSGGATYSKKSQTGSRSANQQMRQDIKQVKSRKDECGVARRGQTGPSSRNRPAPLKSQSGISNLQACVDLCKKSSGCQSCEFGQQKSGGPQQCQLFKVSLSSMPAPPAGASVVGSNAGC